MFCSLFSVSQFCLIVLRYSICIYGESRHLFWIPQYLYVFVAQRPQQVPAAVHSWRCILCICVRKILFVDVSMYLVVSTMRIGESLNYCTIHSPECKTPFPRSRARSTCENIGGFLRDLQPARFFLRRGFLSRCLSCIYVYTFRYCMMQHNKYVLDSEWHWIFDCPQFGTNVETFQISLK